MQKRQFVLLLLIAGLIHSCGYYSFKGALPSHLKTIAIPLFENQTPDPGVAEELLNLLQESFIKDNTLKVVDEARADLVINGTIYPVRIAPGVVKEGEQVAENNLTVSVKAGCLDVKTGRKLFDNTFSATETLDISADLDEREEAIQQALQKISEDIVNATLGAW